jgi:protein tyrosine phosphatase (PTP) superfamily phosphohydrolase (DUF442 family)
VLNQFGAIADLVHACQVLPNVLTGGQPGAAHLHALREVGTNIVLDLRDPMEPRPVDEQAVVQDLGMEYVNIPVTTGALNDGTLERILETVRDAGERTIFCHCNSGGRVGAALMAYLMVERGMNEEDAITEGMRMGLRSVELLEWGLNYARTHTHGSEEAEGSRGVRPTESLDQHDVTQG